MKQEHVTPQREVIHLADRMIRRIRMELFEHDYVKRDMKIG